VRTVIERIAIYLLSRLREPSTWRGLFLLLTALGVQIRPDLWEAIVTVGLALVGAVGVVTPDDPGDQRLHQLRDTLAERDDRDTGDDPDPYRRIQDWDRG